MFKAVKSLISFHWKFSKQSIELNNSKLNNGELKNGENRRIKNTIKRFLDFGHNGIEESKILDLSI